MMSMENRNNTIGYDKYCVLGSKVCPKCMEKLKLQNGTCSYCGAKIRRININRTINMDYQKRIVKYNLKGERVAEYVDVYEAYPIDTKKMQNKRMEVIKNCNGKTYICHGAQWRFALDASAVTNIDYIKAKKGIIKVDFNGNIVEIYDSIKEASQKNKISAYVVSKAISTKKPPKGKDFFILNEKNYCDKDFEEIYIDYLNSQYRVEVETPEGQKHHYKSYRECGEKYSKSATTISDWCKGVTKPKRELRGYKFRDLNIDIKAIEGSCNKGKVAINCEINKENKELKEQIEELKIQRDTLIQKIKKEKKIIAEQNKKLNKMNNNRICIFENTDIRIPYKISIKDFQNLIDKKKYTTAPHIYILTDENGKYYIGQSSRDNYSRILEHFNGQSNDEVYKEYCKGTNFFIEKIIIGWNTTISFDLDKAESFFIYKYDSFKHGYNCTRGNHSESLECIMNHYNI